MSLYCVYCDRKMTDLVSGDSFWGDSNIKSTATFWKFDIFEIHYDTNTPQ